MNVLASCLGFLDSGAASYNQRDSEVYPRRIRQAAQKTSPEHLPGCSPRYYKCKSQVCSTPSVCRCTSTTGQQQISKPQCANTAWVFFEQPDRLHYSSTKLPCAIKLFHQHLQACRCRCHMLLGTQESSPTLQKLRKVLFSS